MEARKVALRLNQRAHQVPTVDNQGLIDHLPKLYDDLIASLRGEPALSTQTGDDAHPTPPSHRTCQRHKTPKKTHNAHRCPRRTLCPAGPCFKN